LKNFLQLLTGQKNLSFCGYINDFADAQFRIVFQKTEDHSKYSIA
jgi:hypothetical protein